MELISIIVLSTLALWVLFALIFPLAVWAKTQSKPIRVLMYIPVAVFLIIDVIYNLIIGSIMFLELPTGRKVWFIETFSERIEENWQKVYLSPHDDYKYKLTKFFRKIILKVDPEHF